MPFKNALLFGVFYNDGKKGREVIEGRFGEEAIAWERETKGVGVERQGSQKEAEVSRGGLDGWQGAAERGRGSGFEAPKPHTGTRPRERSEREVEGRGFLGEAQARRLRKDGRLGCQGKDAKERHDGRSDESGSLGAVEDSKRSSAGTPATGQGRIQETRGGRAERRDLPHAKGVCEADVEPAKTETFVESDRKKTNSSEKATFWIAVSLWTGLDL